MAGDLGRELYDALAEAPGIMEEGEEIFPGTELHKLARRAAEEVGNRTPRGAPVGVAIPSGRWHVAGVAGILLAERPVLLCGREWPTSEALRKAGCGATLGRKEGGVGWQAMAISSPFWEVGSEIAAVVMTSGSQGEPKPIQVKAEAARARAAWAIREMAIESHQSRVAVRACNPFVDALNELIAGVLGRATLVALEPEHLFDPRRLHLWANAGNLTHLSACPSVLAPLASVGHLELASLVSSGEPLGSQLAERLLLQLVSSEGSLRNLYGLAETTGDATSFRLGPEETGKEHFTGRMVPAGHPLPHARVQVRRGGLPVTEANEPGEVHVGGYCLAEGVATDSDGIMATGDCGYFTPQGDLVVRGRLASSGLGNERGRLLPLAEVEDAAQPGQGFVQAACAIPQSERIALLVHVSRCPTFQVDDEAGGSTRQLKARIRRRFPTVKVYATEHPLPHLPSGKLDRERARHVLESLCVSAGKSGRMTPSERKVATVIEACGGEKARSASDELGPDLGLASTGRAAAADCLGLPVEGLLDEEATVTSVASLVRETTSAAPRGNNGDDHEHTTLLPERKRKRSPWRIRRRWRADMGGCIDGTARYMRGMDSVIAASHAGRVSLLDGATGQERWRAECGTRLEGGVATCEQACIAVFGGHDGFVRCLDLASGRLRWQGKAGLGWGVRGTPLISGGLAWVGSDDGFRASFSVDGGEMLLSVEGQGKPVIARPCYVQNGAVVVSPCLAGEVIAMVNDAHSLDVLWRRSLEEPVFADAVEGEGQEVLVAGVAGSIDCLDSRSGARKWRCRSPGGIFSAPAPLRRGAAFACKEGVVMARWGGGESVERLCSHRGAIVAGPVGMGITPDGGPLVVCEREGRVAVVDEAGQDLSEGFGVALLEGEVFARPEIAHTENGPTVIVSCRDDCVHMLRLALEEYDDDDDFS